MLELLTRYLVSNRKVAIPSVGSFSIVTEPARYDVADKLIMPPLFKTEFTDETSLPGSQVDFISGELNVPASTAIQQLAGFGEALNRALQNKPVKWAGIGQLSLENNRIHFDPENYTALEPVPATRVIHQDAKHVIRRGEDQYTADFRHEETIAVTRKKWKIDILGWVLLLLGILFIFFMAWQDQWNVETTGLRKPVL